MPKKELESLSKESAINLAMEQDIIKEYTSRWKITKIEHQTNVDNDTYIYIKTDRTYAPKTNSTDSEMSLKKNLL